MIFFHMSHKDLTNNPYESVPILQRLDLFEVFLKKNNNLFLSLHFQNSELVENLGTELLNMRNSLIIEFDVSSCLKRYICR